MEKPQKSLVFLKWLLVLTGVLLFAFGGVNAYLSAHVWPERVAKEIVGKNKGLRAEVGAVSVTLGWKWIPRLAAHLDQVKIQKIENCQVYQLTVDEARAHLSWRSLMRGEFRVKPVQLGEVDLKVLKDCSLQEETESGEVKESSAKVLPHPAKKSLRKAASFVRPKKPVFTSLSIDLLRLSWQDQVWAFSDLSGGELRDGEVFDLAGRATWQIPEVVKSRWPRVRFKSSLLSDRVELELKGRWLEGEIALSGRWKKEDGAESWKLQSNLSHIPLASLSRGLHGLGLWERPIQFPAVWLSCNLKLEKASRAPAYLAVKGCGVDGKIGRLKLSDLQLRADEENHSRFAVLEPITLKLEGADVEKVLRISRIDMLGGVLSDYGYLDAEIKIDKEGRAECIGQVRDFQFAFSSRGQRGRQSVSSIQGRLSVDGDRVSGKLDQMELKGGLFEGSLSFNFDRRFREGVAQFNIPALQFDPSIQKLLVDGEMSPLALYGKVWVDENRVQNWEAQLGLDQVTNSFSKWQGIRVEVSRQEGHPLFSAQVREGQFKTEGPLAFLSEMGLPADINWQKMQWSLQVQPDLMRWTKGRLAFVEGGELHSQGEWLGQEGLEAHLAIKSKGGKAWALSGSWQNPKVTLEYEKK